jgi:hypothetical protein
MYQVYVKCDHVSPADVKMGRLSANQISVWSEKRDDEAMFIHICDSCKAVMGENFSRNADLTDTF